MDWPVRFPAEMTTETVSVRRYDSADAEELFRSLRDKRVMAVKAVHTLAWFSIESCVLYVLYAGLKGRSNRRAAVAAAVVAGEILIFAANGFRCPLTDLAERLGAERGSVTDIYLPRRFAHNLPVIHVPLVILAVFLHRKSIAACVFRRGVFRRGVEDRPTLEGRGGAGMREQPDSGCQLKRR